MATAEAFGRPSAGRAPALGRGVAFGLKIESTCPVASLVGTAGTPTDSDRRLSLELSDPRDLKALWDGAGATERLFERRLRAHRPALLVDRHRDGGHRVWAPSYGRYHVSSDGLRIRAFIPRSAVGWYWERLFVAQPLPLAAALQGLALIHASAVAVERRAFAFLASSGTGKTSVAVHLVARGARHVTDDIVALEPREGRVLAHPGPRLAGVVQEELARIPPASRERLGSVVGQAGPKTYLAIPVEKRPFPLAAIYYLERDPGHRQLALVDATDPRLLLASSFLSYLRDPAHLEWLLYACAEVTESVRMARVLVPPSASAADVAAALEADMVGTV
jgi:hypothetical protein